MSLNVSLAKRKKPILWAVAAPGREPVPSGCEHAADCFSCPHRDCIASQAKIMGGTVNCEEAINNGLRKQAINMYRAGCDTLFIAAYMGETSSRVSRWLQMGRKAGEIK